MFKIAINQLKCCILQWENEIKAIYTLYFDGMYIVQINYYHLTI